MIAENGLSSQVLEWARERPEAGLLTAKELLHLGNRAAVDQALSRLCKQGHLRRVARGVYMLPAQGRFGERVPSTARLVEALAARRGEPVVRHGAAAANSLGLTTQIPVREVYLTAGPTRRLKLGRQTVEIRHAPAWQLIFPNRLAGDVVRALAWVGPGNAGHAMSQFKNSLPPGELRELLAARRQLPTWIAREVSELARRAA